MNPTTERQIRKLVFKRVTGYYAPGVDIPASLEYREEFDMVKRLKKWDEFNENYYDVIIKTIQAYEEVMDI